jgi:hypothetical protein
MTAADAARITANLCTQLRWPAARHKLWAHEGRLDPIIADSQDQHFTVQVDRRKQENQEKRESHDNQNWRSCSTVRFASERLFI